MITANILMSFTTMRNRQSRVTTPKDFVPALMMLVERVEKPATGRLSVGPKVKYYLKYRCLKPGRAVGAIALPGKAGYTNPYDHLKYCYATDMSKADQEDTLQRLYEKARCTVQHRGVQFDCTSPLVPSPTTIRPCMGILTQSHASKAPNYASSAVMMWCLVAKKGWK